MCHLYPYNNVKLLRKFFYINFLYLAIMTLTTVSTTVLYCDVLSTVDAARALQIVMYVCISN